MNKGRGNRFPRPFQGAGCSKGSLMSRKSRLVSTSTKGPSSIATAGGRSRGTCIALGSAAMAASAALIFAVSELTQFRPLLCAT